MADQTPAPSQGSAQPSRAVSPSGEDPVSSPILPVFGKNHSIKPRKPPTITPRSFTRFFTPKCSFKRGGKIGASRQALRDITASASNRKGRRTPTKDAILVFDHEHENDTPKRRKVWAPTPDLTPDRSSPLKRIYKQSFEIAEDDSDGNDSLSDDEVDHALQKHRHKLQKPDIVKPIAPSRCRNGLGWSLQREVGGISRKPGVNRVTCLPATSQDWQYETSSFYTRPEDAHTCVNLSNPGDHSIPFCTASCNTNSLVAVGDEDGGIRLLESARDQKPDFTKAYVSFRPHANAILDMAFSPDDLLLATASGDQTSQVIDMPTQRATYTMAGHFSSVKQVCFQPGSSSVIATSSRDGSVQIWDLRCKSSEAPVRAISVSLDGEVNRQPPNQKMLWAKSVNTIADAHATRQSAPSASASSVKTTSNFDAPSKTESPGRRGDVSITALSFLTPERGHLLLTGSEANASIKLWDLRTTHNGRRSRATPLSSTRQPESHNKYRHFGLTSLSLSGNGSHLYALCRDNTVYAYSVSHLILGHAPELSKHGSKPRRSGGPEKEGLGPMYGFRHPNLHATTFYVKSALRPAKGNNSELLAVGSSDGCVVLFPTHERYMASSLDLNSHQFESFNQRSRPTLVRTDSGTGLSARLTDTIPIYQHGSALVRGHGREVTGVTWTPRGDLVSVGDDCLARCWREGLDARDLRLGGENEGRRWGCGWAEVEDGWDDDDC